MRLRPWHPPKKSATSGTFCRFDERQSSMVGFSIANIDALRYGPTRAAEQIGRDTKARKVHMRNGV